MVADGFNATSITLKEQSCFFLIATIESGSKYINFPKESVKTNFYEIIFITNGYNIATSVTLTNGVPIETVCKMLGHKNIKTTQHYSKILDKKVSEDIKILKEQFLLTSKSNKNIG